jgi:hypothetical protein
MIPSSWPSGDTILRFCRVRHALFAAPNTSVSSGTIARCSALTNTIVQ